MGRGGAGGSWCMPFPCVHSVTRDRATSTRGQEALASLQMHVVKLGTCLEGPPPLRAYPSGGRGGWEGEG
jgi:hypothetical protein